MTTYTSRPVFLIRFADGTFLGAMSPRVSNPEHAGCFRQVDEAQARQQAQVLGGVAVLYAYSKAQRLVEFVEAPAAKVLAFVRA